MTTDKTDTRDRLAEAIAIMSDKKSPARLYEDFRLKYGHSVEMVVLDAARRDLARMDSVPVEGWQDIGTAPRDESLFVCRTRLKPWVQFEAAIYWEYPGFEETFEPYWILQNMTTDEPVEDTENLEWMPLIRSRGRDETVAA
jgi:hypothetical protein